ncbi:MAG: hypothetical protein KF819_14020 [Labilithrix sp.]|nr:hypothetical protein [Labilithrix sp.]
MCRMHVYGCALALLAACSKAEEPTPTPATAVPTEAPTIAITGTPIPASAAPSASASGSASVVASAAPPASAAPVASTPASAMKAIASASSAPAAPPEAKALADAPKDAGAAPVAPVALRPAATRMSGKNFTLDAASPGCRVDTPCTMTLRLVASGEYHVNKEYPYKFIASPGGGVQFLGSGDANTFSRASGDFREEGEKAATLTVRFKPTAPGDAKVSGTYKMSVCSSENCQIETQAVSLSVPVM